jgi:hypothetical protein
VVARLVGVMLVFFLTSQDLAARSRIFPYDRVKSIEITIPIERDIYEEKHLLDCDTVQLKESDVMFALRHMRSMSERRRNSMGHSGCSAAARIFFKDGSVAIMAIEVNVAINLWFERRAGGKQVAGKPKVYFFECARCESDKGFMSKRS